MPLATETMSSSSTSEDEDNGQSVWLTSSISGNSGKKKKNLRGRKKKTKSKEKNMDAPNDVKTTKSIMKKCDSSQSLNGESKTVTFDQVFVRTFSRALGYDAVPCDGSWPLGLSFEVTEELEGDLQSFENRRSVELRTRAMNMIEKEKQNNQSRRNQQNLDIDPEKELETRQYDYRKGQRNPLFKSLSEGYRQDILLAALDPDHSHDCHAKEKRGRKHSSQRRRTRGLSQADLKEMRDNPSGITIEMEIDHEITLLRNELEAIRDHRSSVGCTCRKLKKINKLSDRRLRDELRKRHLPTSGKKNELCDRLNAAIEKEPCCSKTCPCVQEGINCQADLCSCWHGDKKQTSDPDLISRCAKRCGNQFGMYIYDANLIRNKRQNLICTVVNA